MNYFIDWIAGQDGRIYVAEADARKSAKIHVVNNTLSACFVCIYTELQPNAHSNRLIWLIISDTIINIRTNTYTQIYTWNKIYYYLLVIPISKKMYGHFFLWFSLSLRNSVFAIAVAAAARLKWLFAWIHVTCANICQHGLLNDCNNT